MGDMTKKQNLLTAEQGEQLVRLVRKTLEEALSGNKSIDSDHRAAQSLEDTPAFQIERGVFVTLKKRGQLRGCIGSLSGLEPIWRGVRTHAVNAAFHDPRFVPLNASELDDIHIEVSVLTEPQVLDYTDSSELIDRLRPNVDGVILRKGHASATYLPQVWDQIPDTASFLSSLCMKAGLSADTWRRSPMVVETYQVQSFEEP